MNQVNCPICRRNKEISGNDEKVPELEMLKEIQLLYCKVCYSLFRIPIKH